MLYSTSFAVVLTAALLCLAARPGAFFICARKRPLLLLLNGIPIWLLTLTAYAALGVFAFVVIAALTLILTLINHFKVLIREEPFLPSDFILLREAMAFSDAAKGHMGVTPILIIAGLAALITGSFWLPAPLWNGYQRLAAAAVALAAFFLLNAFVYANDGIFKRGPVSGSPLRPVDLCESRGFLYAFWHHINKLGVVKPEGYDAGRAAALLSCYSAPKQAVQGVNVIFVMGEAFTELSEESFFQFEEDPLAPYQQLKKEGFSGKLIVPNYGGGTANTEFDVLTGLYSMYINPSPSSFWHVRKSVPSVVSTLRSHGYGTTAVHPGYDWFYGRKDVYPRLGFDKFLTVREFAEAQYKGGLVSDRSAFQKLREILGPAPSFSYLVTIQTHTPFENKFERDACNFCQARPFLTPSETDILSNYFIGVADASRELWDFAQFLNDRPEPTLLVFYGDHLPSLGSAMRIYNELGFDEGLRKYETNYLLWQNEASKPIFNLEKSLEAAGMRRGKPLSAHYLGALVLEMLGLDGEQPFFQFVNAMRRENPILTVYEPPQNAQAAAEYRAVQYERLQALARGH